MSAIHFRKAKAGELPDICRLLEEEKLPTADLTESRQEFFVATDADKLVGTIALEVYHETALLRSMMVNRQQRNNGIASRLVSDLVAYAAEKSIRSLYLITNTAEEYFRTKGFLKISREQVDKRLLASAEFNGLCPASSVIMVKQL